MIRSSASAKVILLGEHAVVYHQPAIAVPITSLRSIVEVIPSTVFKIIARDLNIELDGSSDQPFVQMVRRICHQANRPLPPFTFIIYSQIPVASGLGSGASIATALARAVFQVLVLDVSIEVINEHVYEVEKVFHGSPSGIDNTVISYEKPILYIRSQPINVIRKFVHFILVIANTGVEAPTKQAVGDVRALYESAPDRVTPVFIRIGEIVMSGFNAMQNGHIPMLGDLMNENHALLQQLTVSSPQLDHLVDAARYGGALGAKLSGGGRGGNMIALVSRESATNVAQHLYDAGANQVFITEVTP